MNEDFRDLLAALLEEGARFLVVGAHALAVHGFPRATGDLDVWVDPAPPNAERVWRALLRFGTLGVVLADLETPGMVLQLGQPPRRIDLLTEISGVSFVDAWAARLQHSVAGMSLPFLSRRDLVRNKRASGRAKDLADLETLGNGEDAE